MVITIVKKIVLIVLYLKQGRNTINVWNKLVGKIDMPLIGNVSYNTLQVVFGNLVKCQH